MWRSRCVPVGGWLHLEGDSILVVRDGDWTWLGAGGSTAGGLGSRERIASRRPTRRRSADPVPTEPRSPYERPSCYAVASLSTTAWRTTRWCGRADPSWALITALPFSEW